MLTVDPWKPVTVEQDGRWPGWLRAWRRSADGGRAFVQYRRGPGLTYLHWVDASRVTHTP